MNINIDRFDVVCIALGTALIMMLDGTGLVSLFTATGSYLFGKIVMTYILERMYQ